MFHIKAKQYTLSKKDYIQKKEQEKADVIEKLEQGVKDVFTSEKYKEVLATYGKFHDYSVNNTILILLQKPSAIRVASFHTWRGSSGAR